MRAKILPILGLLLFLELSLADLRVVQPLGPRGHGDFRGAAAGVPAGERVALQLLAAFLVYRDDVVGGGDDLIDRAVRVARQPVEFPDRLRRRRAEMIGELGLGGTSGKRREAERNQPKGCQ